MAPFSANQIRSIEIAERTSSVVSLVGSLFIITTFSILPAFRKPINRLVMYASLGNVLCNIATLISVSGVEYGIHHPLCKFQAFLIQMFIPADSLWTFCMSLNVYLTFFKGCDSSHLRALEKWYFLFCYGTPLIPALIFLLMDAAGHFDIYGPATLWCWIYVKWDWMRIAFFYGPVWIVIGITTAIYLITGKAIFKHRAALRAFSRNPTMPLPLMENPFTSDNLAAVTKVTEIEVITETIRSPSVDGPNKCSSSDSEGRSSFSSTRKLSNGQMPNHPTRFPRHSGNNNNNTNNPNAGAWPYPSQDRSGHEADTTPNYTTKITAGGVAPMISPPPIAMDDDIHGKPTGANGRRRNAAMHANTAAWGYAKVAMLMFIALFIVWVPSTINRVWSLIHPNQPSFPLSFFAGLVLPLQGFWNAMVYIATTWRQCRTVLRNLWRGSRQRGTTIPANNFSGRLGHLNRQSPSFYRQRGRGASKASSLGHGLGMRSDYGDIDIDSESIDISTSKGHQHDSKPCPPTPQSPERVMTVGRSDSTAELTDFSRGR